MQQIQVQQGQHHHAFQQLASGAPLPEASIAAPQEAPSITIIGCTVPETFREALRKWNDRRIVSPVPDCFALWLALVKLLAAPHRTLL